MKRLRPSSPDDRGRCVDHHQEQCLDEILASSRAKFVVPCLAVASARPRETNASAARGRVDRDFCLHGLRPSLRQIQPAAPCVRPSARAAAPPARPKAQRASPPPPCSSSNWAMAHGEQRPTPSPVRVGQPDSAQCMFFPVWRISLLFQRQQFYKKNLDNMHIITHNWCIGLK